MKHPSTLTSPQLVLMIRYLRKEIVIYRLKFEGRNPDSLIHMLNKLTDEAAKRNITINDPEVT